MNTAEYLIKKLEELGINDFFGLPGDYNFNILYAIENNPNTKWIGCTNELNAGYAADGYARERGYGAVVTTYGVGELSAMNAIAGSYAENIPVIHIVGAPAQKCIDDKALIHHNFRNPRPYAFQEAYKQVTETTAFLNRDNAKLEVDRVLKVFVKEKRPVYISIPLDVAQLEISEREIDYNWTSNEENLKVVIEKILDKIKKSENPIILGDILVKRFDAQLEYKEFVEKSGIPATNFLMGSTLLNSDCKNYLGTYFSKYKSPNCQKYLENTDCLIAVGAIYSDLNSFGFGLPYKINSHIAIYGTYTYIEGQKYENVKMSDVLEGITNAIDSKDFEIEKDEIGYGKPPIQLGKLTSEYIYPRVQEFLQENDILIAETGIIPQGIAPMKLPNNMSLHAQILWGSIGWATPATLGASIASPNSRVILFTGEGSHQLTALEIGNMLRQGIKPVIIVLNNGGYTIERILSNSTEDKFNDIVHMNYSKFARVFEGDIWATKVETADDFDKALKVTKIMDKLCYIEVCTDKLDMPELTEKLIKTLQNSVKCENKHSHFVPEVSNNSESRTYGTMVHESLRELEE